MTPLEMEWKLRDDAHEKAMQKGALRDDGLLLCDCGICYGAGMWYARCTIWRHRKMFKRIRRARAYADAVEVSNPDVRLDMASDDDACPKAAR